MPRLGLSNTIVSDIQHLKSAVSTDFISTWATTGSDEKITVPFEADGNSLNFTIDWGDGNSDTVTASSDDLGGGAIDHTYSSADTYTITMVGAVSGIKFNNGGDKTKIKTIANWGNYIMSKEDAFYGCTALNVTAADAPDLSDVTAAHLGIQRCFQDCTSLTSVGGAASWDLSGVSHVEYMFAGATSFNQDISMWDMSNVVTIQSMFHGATSFNQPIGAWTTSSLLTLARTFQNATAFNQRLNVWDWSENTDAWDMFRDATQFNNGGVAPNWDMTKCVYFVEMFYGTPFNQDMSGCTGIGLAAGSSGAWYRSMFAQNTAFDQNIGHFAVTNVKESAHWGMGNMFAGTGSGLSTANYNPTLIAWAAVDATDGVNFGGGESESTGDGDTARADLISTDSWVITDADS